MSKLLDPKVLMAIKELTLSARMTIDSFLRGVNKSAAKGTGLEFSQYRSYQPGDDLRSLDWKIFARSDRYYIRESETETNLSVNFLIDASASMNHFDGDFSKFAYAKYLAACLAYLCNMQGDAIGLYLFKEDGVFSLAPRRSFQHLSRLLYQLEQVEAGGVFSLPLHFKSLFSGHAKRELTVLITDMYETNGELTQLLDSISTRNEALVFHLMAQNELSFDFGTYNTLEDLESGEIIEINPQTARDHYTEQLNSHLNKVKHECLNRHISYRLMRTDMPVDQALRDFLNQRNKVGG